MDDSSVNRYFRDQHAHKCIAEAFKKLKEAEKMASEPLWSTLKEVINQLQDFV